MEKRLKILVTSGGTSEKIDQVREISNMATGRLGSLIAEAFYEQVQAEVTYVYGPGAVCPGEECARRIPITSARDLENTLKQCFTDDSYDAVIHAMAVSDYTRHSAVHLDQMSAALAEVLQEDLEKLQDKEGLTSLIQETILRLEDQSSRENKISSSGEHLVLTLKKTPKVIHMIKEQQPDTTLVGFKLLSGVSREELIQVAGRLLERNDCDYVLANDLEDIKGDQHKAMLISGDGVVAEAKTKKEIARMIVNAVALQA